MSVHSLLDSWRHTAESLAAALAEHYGGVVVACVTDRGGSFFEVVLTGEGSVGRYCVASVKGGVVGRNGGREIWIYCGGRGAGSRDSWVIGDAVAFVDRIRNAGGVAGVMSNDGVTFRYTLSVSVTVKAMRVQHVGALELVCLGLENAETGDEITGEDYDLIVNTCGPIADLRLSDELGVIS